LCEYGSTPRKNGNGRNKVSRRRCILDTKTQLPVLTNPDGENFCLELEVSGEGRLFINIDGYRINGATDSGTWLYYADIPGEYVDRIKITTKARDSKVYVEKIEISNGPCSYE